VTSVDRVHEEERGGTAAHLLHTLRELDDYARRADFRGYDPYDALMSPIFRLPILRSNRYIRLGAQQVLRRLPVNLRPVLGIRKHSSAVTCARMLEGYVCLSGRGDDYEEPIDACLRRLSELRSCGYSGDCWGYEFDWEPRHAARAIPAGVPNIVATGIVANSLFETYRLTRNRSARDSCESAAQFLLRDLERTRAPNGSFCWGYFPLDRQLVLNANMKGARLCAQVFSITGDTELREAAHAAVKFVVAHQRPDGAWPYAVGDVRSWVDNFHTGYLLDALDAYERYADDRTFEETKERGWRYYRTHFLTTDCAPRSLDHKLYPVDATACAQTITTLCTFEDVPTAVRTAEWTLANMRRRDGAFIYQRHAHYKNRIPYMRWSVAPMFSALSRLLREIDVSAGDTPSRIRNGPSGDR
jgi:hypothetical protein